MNRQLPPRCTEKVSRGRMGASPCFNPPKEGDTLCSTHRAMVERRTAAPITMVPQVPPQVQVRRTVSVTLSWEPGDGPVFRSRYETRDSVWTWLRAKQDESGGNPVISGRGLVLKKDGMAGQQSIELRFADWTDLPDYVQQMFTEQGIKPF